MEKETIVKNVAKELNRIINDEKIGTIEEVVEATGYTKTYIEHILDYDKKKVGIIPNISMHFLMSLSEKYGIEMNKLLEESNERQKINKEDERSNIKIKSELIEIIENCEDKEDLEFMKYLLTDLYKTAKNIATNKEENDETLV